MDLAAKAAKAAADHVSKGEKVHEEHVKAIDKVLVHDQHFIDHGFPMSTLGSLSRTILMGFPCLGLGSQLCRL